MSESLNHMNYVREIVGYILDNIENSSLMYLGVELPEYNSHSQKVVNGFIPDVYYKDETKIIIGEAKIVDDIEKKHTYEQINSYIAECRLYPLERHIVLSTSLYGFPTFHNLISRKKRNENLTDIKFHIIDDCERVKII